MNEYSYLGRKFQLGKKNQIVDFTGRIGLDWAAYSNLIHILNNTKIPINLQKRIYDTCVLPVLTDDIEKLFSPREEPKSCGSHKGHKNAVCLGSVSVIDSRMKNVSSVATSCVGDMISRETLGGP